jgi:3-hydroxyisobutyrate dehydrogenase-like beta-hydroxyacid dehydrogenase
MKNETVGLVGLGLMGEVLAGRLLAAGFGVLGFDIEPAKNVRLAALGGQAADKLYTVAACQRIVLALFNTDQVAALAARLAGTALHFLEAPVSGTSEQVRRGDGVGLIGGDAQIAAAVAPILDAMFPRRFHIGKVGDGGRAKLAVNLILGLNRLALAEGLVFAERLGLDGKAFLEVARRSASYSQVMDTKGAKMLAREFSPEGRVKQTLKDVHIMLDQAKRLGQQLPMLNVHADVLESCVRQGEGERDNSIIVEEIRRRRRLP